MKFVGDDGVFDHDALAEATRVATRFLDNVIEYNMDNHALQDQRCGVLRPPRWAGYYRHGRRIGLNEASV